MWTAVPVRAEAVLRAAVSSVPWARLLSVAPKTAVVRVVEGDPTMVAAPRDVAPPTEGWEAFSASAAIPLQPSLPFAALTGTLGGCVVENVATAGPLAVCVAREATRAQQGWLEPLVLKSEWPWWEWPWLVGAT